MVEYAYEYEVVALIDRTVPPVGTILPASVVQDLIAGRITEFTETLDSPSWSGHTEVEIV